MSAKYTANSEGELILTDANGDSRRLSNYIPKLVELQRVDDGFNIIERMIFAAYRKGKRELPVALTKEEIENGRFNAKFAPGCRIELGRGNKACVGEMMLMQAEDAELVTRYRHTGFIEDNGEWVYLNGDCSISADGLTDRYSVELEGTMSKFCFYEVNIDDAECFDKFLNRMGVAIPDHIRIPLLSFVFLSPLNTMLREKGVEPTITLYIIGRTGSFKTSIVKVYLCFFGKFENTTPAPMNFDDSLNALTRKAALGADLPMLLDDRRVSTTAYDKQKYEKVEKHISSVYGDKTSRGRCNPDGTLQNSMVARGNLIVTAEEAYQNIGNAAIGRALSVEMHPGDITDEAMTEMQDLAPVWNKLMQMYIRWIIRNYDRLSKELPERFARFRAEQQNRDHKRLGTSTAHLSIGYSCMLDFLQDAGAIDEATAVSMMQMAQAIFREMSSKQGERVAEEKPTELFLNTLHELVMTRDAKLCEFDSDTPANYISPATVGFIDKSNGDVYLIKGKVYAAVCEQLARCGSVFPVSATNLWKHLAEEHLSSVNKGRYDKKKQIPGVAGNWFIHIPSAVWGNADREEVKE